ncbi:MAG: ABC transporter substrate-binding protein [Thermoplasmata archaeon]
MAVLVAFVALAGLPSPAQAQVAPFGPWVDEVIWSQNDDTSIVLTKIIDGTEDYFLFTVIGATNKLRAAAANEIWTIRTFGSWSGFLMNPIEQVTGFNPFTIPEVREGIQWLVDRDLIAREVYAGFATPYLGPYHPKSADFGRYIADIIKLEDKYVNDPARARDQITTALTAAGASTNANGKWLDSDGNLIELNIWARIEDERLIEGQYIADLLDGMGFTVNFMPIDRSFISKVYGGPSDQGLWHIYTAGWISTAQINIDDWQLYDFYGCYWEDWCTESGQVNGYKAPQNLWDAYEKLAFGEYATFDERNALVSGVLDQVHPNAYRAWTVAEESVYPVNNRVSAAFDFFGGPVHELFARTAKLSDAPNADGSGGSLRAVNYLVGQDAWNPYIAVGTLYDSDIRDMIVDFGVLRHPHTGRIIDARNTVTVETAGPDGTLTVPSSAEMFDPTTNTWSAVGVGVTATSKVTVDLSLGKFHHGPDMTMMDLRNELGMMYRRTAMGDIGALQPNAIDAGEEAFMPKYKAYDFVDADTMVTYVDFFHLDDREIADVGSFWPNVPWETAEVMAGAMLDGLLAASEVDADGLAIPWMDVTKGASLPILKTELAALKAVNHKPVGLEGMITDAEATARWTALDDWVTARGHFMATTGPFWLESLNTAEWIFTLKAFRDGYPLRADHYEQYRVAKVPRISLSAPDTVFSGTPAVFDFTSVVGGSPFDNIDSKWFLKDLASGNIIMEGTASQVGAGAYRIEIPAAKTTELLFGNFELILVVTSPEAAPPSISRAPFLILPSTAFFEGLLSATESALRGDIESLESQQSDLTQSVNDAVAATQGLTLLVTTLAILAVIAIAVAVVSVILVLRRARVT